MGSSRWRTALRTAGGTRSRSSSHSRRNSAGLVGFPGELGQPVEERGQVVADHLVRVRHRAPAVPGQQLDVDQGRGVAHEVAGDPPVAGLAELAEPELRRVGGAGAEPPPTPRRRQELVPGHVGEVEVDVEQPCCTSSICASTGPSAAARVPVLADPVVLEPVPVEVPAEPAARPGRRAVRPQQRDLSTVNPRQLLASRAAGAAARRRAAAVLATICSSSSSVGRMCTLPRSSSVSVTP